MVKAILINLGRFFLSYVFFSFIKTTKKNLLFFKLTDFVQSLNIWEGTTNVVSTTGSFLYGTGKGVVNSAVGTVTGIYDAVSNPLGTAQSVGSAIYNYDKTANAITTSFSNGFNTLVNGNAEQKGEVVGQVIGAVGELFLGTKGLSKVDDIVKTARLEKTLTNLASEAKTNVTNRTGLLEGQKGFGTKAHTEFKNLVDAKNLKNVKTEQSYLNNRPANYGQRGSSRADVVVTDKSGNKVKKVYDFKTGSAILSQEQRAKYIRNVKGIDKNSQIKEIR